MQNKGLLDVIETLMEAEMTKKDPIQNPQEETDEMEEETGEKLEKAPSKDEVGSKQGDGVTVDGPKAAGGDPDQTKINKAPVVNEEDDVEEEDEPVSEAEDPDQTKINKAEEPESGSGKVAGKDKMNVEAADVEEEEETVSEGKVGIQVIVPVEAIHQLRKFGVKAEFNRKLDDEIIVDTKDKKKVVDWMTKDGGWSMRDIKDLYPELLESVDVEEEEIEEADGNDGVPVDAGGDPNKGEINKAEEPKSGSGKVAGKDTMKVEAADCDEEEETVSEEQVNEASRSAKAYMKAGKLGYQDQRLSKPSLSKTLSLDLGFDKKNEFGSGPWIQFDGVDMYSSGGKEGTILHGALTDKYTYAELKTAAAKWFGVKESVEQEEEIEEADVYGDGKGKAVAGADPDKEEINKAPVCNEEDEVEEEEETVSEERPEYLKKAIGKAIEKKKEAAAKEEEVKEGEDLELDRDGDGKHTKKDHDMEEDEVEEELSAKQKKLDIDGDGEIGKDDLKKVRAGQTAEETDCEEEEDLDEDFRTKASIIFETAVNEKVNTKVATLQEEYDNKLNEEISTINEKVSEYIDYAVQSWLEENKLEIKYSLRTEISENFIKGLKTLFQENYIEIPEEEISVVDELTETVESYKEQLDEQTNELEAARKEILGFHRQATLDEITEGLTQTQALKLEKLSEAVEAVDIEEFKFKVQALKESYFDKDGNSPLLTEEVLDGMGIEIEEAGDHMPTKVDMYASFLGRTAQK